MTPIAYCINNENIGFIRVDQTVQVNGQGGGNSSSTGCPASLSVTTPTGPNTKITDSYAFVNGVKILQSSNIIESLEDATGTSRIETVTTITNGVPSTVRNVYDNDGNLFNSTPVAPSAAFNITNQQATEGLNALNAFLGAIRGGKPVPLLTSGCSLAYTLGGRPASLQGANTVLSGLGSLYGLHNAFGSGATSDLARTQATLSSINYFNNTFFTSTNASGQVVLNNATSQSLNNVLNGQGGLVEDAVGNITAGELGLANGGIPGALPVLGLLLSIKAKDPIGIASGLIGIFNPALLTTGPLGWILAGASILRAVFAEGPPDAWGVANVSYGAGFDNLHLTVNASGESFGTQRVRETLQGIATYLQGRVDTINAQQAAGQQVGLIAQRMPSLTWRASEFGDKGFSIVDIDPLTGEQKFPYRRFDDQGVPFSSNPALYQVDLSDPEQRGGLNDAMLRAAYRRGAIAPLWEVQTAKLQGDAGVPDAGLSEEERAAKHGLGAALDTAYAAAHAGDPAAKHKRIGSFMAVELDLDGSGSISTHTMAGNAAGAGTITFNWDNQGYQKEVGSIDANDGYLVLDRDFNQSIDNGTELLSNPLVADPAKGLRSLAGWDTQMDHLSAMHSIAAYAIFHWAGGVNNLQSRAVNDDVWRKAA